MKIICDKTTSEYLKSNAKMILVTNYRLASVGILGKEREPGVGKLDWHGNFDTEFKRNT